MTIRQALTQRKMTPGTGGGRFKIAQPGVAPPQVVATTLPDPVPDVLRMYASGTALTRNDYTAIAFGTTLEASGNAITYDAGTKAFALNRTGLYLINGVISIPTGSTISAQTMMTLTETLADGTTVVTNGHFFSNWGTVNFNGRVAFTRAGVIGVGYPLGLANFELHLRVTTAPVYFIAAPYDADSGTGSETGAGHLNIERVAA